MQGLQSLLGSVKRAAYQLVGAGGQGANWLIHRLIPVLLCLPPHTSIDCPLPNPAACSRTTHPTPAVRPAMQAAARPCGAAVPSSAAVKISRHQRLGRLVVQAVASAQPTTRLRKEDLVAYIASGCKPRDQWRCAMSGRVWQLTAAAAASCRCDVKGGIVTPARPACCLPM